MKKKQKKPVYEKPVKIKWFNGVPFGGSMTDLKEIYMERMMEYERKKK